MRFTTKIPRVGRIAVDVRIVEVCDYALGHLFFGETFVVLRIVVNGQV